jgi:hypothetical protein
VAKNTVRIFKLIWMSLQDVYSMRGKEKQCVQALKVNHGVESVVIKNIIILKWVSRNISGACILDMSGSEYGPVEDC